MYTLELTRTAVGTNCGHTKIRTCAPPFAEAYKFMLMECAYSNDEPLPLSQLRNRVSANTFTWLEEAELKERIEREALEEDEALTSSASFFAQNDNDDDDEEEKELNKRVMEWRSSSTNPDGIGGYDDRSEGVNDDEESDDGVVVKVQYILSEASGGHGETIWAAARHAANLFADEKKCRTLLDPLFTYLDAEEGTKMPITKHPLLDLRFLELGAGGGIPSWSAMRCGAKVVCTDQSIPGRIRCLAESAERNRYDMLKNIAQRDSTLVTNAEAVRVCPYNWGTAAEEVTHVLDGTNSKFDVVIAADCIYMPDFHAPLLDSIHMLMSGKGVALLPFALHGNTKDEKVWGIVDLAKEKGFEVDVLGAQQLTPQCSNMDDKRGLVHTLRLTFTQSRNL